MRVFIGGKPGGAAGRMSLVTAPYGSGGRMLGCWGVIGPSRMAYELRVIPVVEATAPCSARRSPPTLNPSGRGPIALKVDAAPGRESMTPKTMSKRPDAGDARHRRRCAADRRTEALRAELEQLKAQSLIERADLENQRKRLAREIEQARKFANERPCSATLLPLFDSMEAGFSQRRGGRPLRAGLELTLRQLAIVAGKNGLTEVAPAAGDAFNPEHHQAMGMVDAEGVARRSRADLPEGLRKPTNACCGRRW